MLSTPGAPLRTCQGVSRRELLQAGELGFLGLTLPDLLRAQAQAAVPPRGASSTFGKAKSCLIVFLNGGASHHDTFDMKPDMGEFGRSPKITASNAGREHWPFVFTILLAGAGIPGGRLYGSSDKHGAYPLDHRITPGELVATIFHALGIDSRSQVTTLLERPWQICDDRPVLDLWG